MLFLLVSGMNIIDRNRRSKIELPGRAVGEPSRWMESEPWHAVLLKQKRSSEVRDERMVRGATRIKLANKQKSLYDAQGNASLTH
jgi:hypothetical protein